MKHDDPDDSRIDGRHDRPPREDRPARAGAGGEDSRRWGDDPTNDRSARGGGDGLADRHGRDDTREGGPSGDARAATAFGQEHWRPSGDDGGDIVDTPHDPGRPAHMATGSGGSGDWGASAAGSGQRRGPVDVELPFELGQRLPADRLGAEHHGDDGPDDRGGWPLARSAAGTSDGGWSSAGSARSRWSEAPPPQAPAAPVRPPDTERPRGPKDWQRSDERIHDDICVRLSRETALDAGDVTVSVREGQVILTGTVADLPTKHAIESLVERCQGVREIDNHIKVMRGGLPPHPDAPPTPRRWVPRDSPTARDEAEGRHTEPSADPSGRYG